MRRQGWGALHLLHHVIPPHKGLQSRGSAAGTQGGGSRASAGRGGAWGAWQALAGLPLQGLGVVQAADAEHLHGVVHAPHLGSSSKGVIRDDNTRGFQPVQGLQLYLVWGAAWHCLMLADLMAILLWVLEDAGLTVECQVDSCG